MSDGDGGTATRTATTVVANVAPSITAFSLPATGTEGTAIPFSVTAFDPGGTDDPLSYLWTFTRTDGWTTSFNTRTGNFTPPDNGSYSAVVKISDDDGGQYIRPASTVVVSNAAPTINTMTVPTTGVEGTPVDFHRQRHRSGRTE